MASESTTPVRVPKAAATYTPTTQDPDLRSQINTVLLRDGHVSKIHESLLHALNASSTNWPTLIQNHALELLRSGDCTTFPALMSRVLEDVRQDTLEARGREAGTLANGTSITTTTTTTTTSTATGVNAPAGGNQKGKGSTTAGASAVAVAKVAGRGEGGASLALPKSVVDEGVRITRECLELVCEVGE